MQRERSAVPECSARRRVPTWASGDHPLYAPALMPTNIPAGQTGTLYAVDFLNQCLRGLRSI